MAKLGTKAIRDRAVSIIQENPGGIRFSEIVKQIRAVDPETTPSTIARQIQYLDQTNPNDIAKPSRGLYQPLESIESGKINITPTRCREQDFYDSFALWLKNDLDEATEAASLGAAGGGKWSTPDVVGVYRSQRSDFIKFEAEIIAAEIKIEPEQSVVAFGQAVAYRLFAAKSYIVMPQSISEDDKSRLEALCMLHGIGLVLFKADPTNPEYTIRVRAQRALPDMFYVNQFAERIRQRDSALFNKLFG